MNKQPDRFRSGLSLGRPLGPHEALLLGYAPIQVETTGTQPMISTMTINAGTTYFM